MPASRIVVSVVGARPQFVKLAPIQRAIAAEPGIRHRVVHTGQHYDTNMSKSFFDELQLADPDFNLNVGSGSHAEQTASMLTKLEAVFRDVGPDAVLTYGDTNSTLAATLAAAKMHIPLGHVEAGLRSFNRSMPEEVNRIAADHCSDRLYAPSARALANLEKEGLQHRAAVTGDVMLEAVQHNIELASAKSRVLEELGLEPKAFGLVTVHRAVNTTSDALRSLLANLEAVAKRHLRLVFPVHPRTSAVLETLGYVPPPDLLLVAPLSYLDSISSIAAAAIVITDSGGVQKEAAFLHTPCLTIRDETEWTETIDMGVNRLVGNAGSGLVGAVEDVLTSPDPFDEAVLSSIATHYGRGDAAVRIVRDCIERLTA